jgi:hypothetical protein
MSESELGGAGDRACPIVGSHPLKHHLTFAACSTNVLTCLEEMIR